MLYYMTSYTSNILYTHIRLSRLFRPFSVFRFAVSSSRLLFSVSRLPFFCRFGHSAASKIRLSASRATLRS